MERRRFFVIAPHAPGCGWLAGRLLYLVQRLFLFVGRNGARQMKFTVQAQRSSTDKILFTFLFHIRTSLSIAHGQGLFRWGRSLRAAVCLGQLCRVFHLLGNRTGPVGIVRRRTQLIVGRLFFRQRAGIGQMTPSQKRAIFHRDALIVIDNFIRGLLWGGFGNVPMSTGRWVE